MKTNQKNNRTSSIESVINAIEKNLLRNMPAGFFVERKITVKGRSYKGLLCITMAGDSKNKDDKYTLVTFAFYASTYFPSRLDSVAIYSEFATSILAQIRVSKNFFGIPVLESRIEYGRRPFVDLKLPQNIIVDPYAIERMLINFI